MPNKPKYKKPYKKKNNKRNNINKKNPYRNGIIYKIFHKTIKDIVYIGSTVCRLSTRWKRHKISFSNWNNGYTKSKCAICPYFKQYGVKNFECIVLGKYKIVDSKHLNVYGFKAILSLIFKNNYFKCNGKYFKQNTGLFMGCICGPSVANLYLYILEMKWIVINRPLIYNRFIDDIFLVTNEEIDQKNFTSTFIYLELNIVKAEKVNFLDLEIFENRFKSSRFCIQKYTQISFY